MKRIKNQKGYSLPELVAVLPLGLIIMAALTMGILEFVKNYQEITLYSDLQQEVMQTIETIRYGYAKTPYTDNQILIGLVTANEVILQNNAQGSSRTIKLIPVDLTSSNGETTNYSRFYLNRNNELMVTSSYDGRTFTERVFPTDNRKIGKHRKFEIINQDIFTNVTPSNQDKIYLVKIHIKARVRFRKKSKHISKAQDLKQNTKTVDFETVVYVSNVKEET